MKKLDYEFTSLEAAWLIYQCRNATLKEKHAAWRELTETMPDCSIAARPWTSPQESLHAFLKEYSDLENRLIDRFKADGRGHPSDNGKPCVYRVDYWYKGDDRPYHHDTVFSSFDAVCSDGMKPEENVIKVICVKNQIDRPSSGSRAVLTPDFEFLEIEPDPDELEKREDEIFNLVFDGLWFDFPTPFKNGDIVWDPIRPDHDRLCSGPYVLAGAGLGEKKGKLAEHLKENGDTSDMNTWGYFASEDGNIYYEVTWNYMDVEFYCKELTGASRVLMPLSSFLKGKIDAELYARAYHQIRAQLYADLCMPRDFTHGGMVLAGLAKPERVKLWLDDLREAPEGYVWCKSVNIIKRKILQCEENRDVIDVIDCDHDLGDFAKDGGDGIKLLDWLAERGTFYPIALHTMNPVGRENMQNMIDRYWKNS